MYSNNRNNENNEVKIIDVDIPFFSIVKFMVLSSIATIPAIITLSGVFYFVKMIIF